MNNSLSENLSIHSDDSTTYQQQQIQQSISFILDLRFFLFRFFYPCLLVWGIIGNTLCLRVLLSKKFNKNSTCQYLAILAVIDILFMLMRSSKHIYKFFRDAPIFNTSKWICRVLTFSSSAVAHLASWMLVIVSFDRYFIVTSRYRRHGSTFLRVFYSTTILILVVGLCNLYYFFIQGRTVALGGYSSMDQRRALSRLLSASNDTSSGINSINYSSLDFFRYKTSKIFVCIPSRGYERFFRTYIPIFDILLVAVIPFVLLCFTNLGIILFTMKNSKRMMRQHRKRTHRRHQRLTIMLLSVTLAFIGLACPSVIFICVNKIIYSNQIIPGEKDSISSRSNVGQPSYIQILVDICDALWYTKHAMNFILYTLSGQDFRREFLKLFPQCLTRRIAFCRKMLNNSPTSLALQTTTGTEESKSHAQIHILDAHQALIPRTTISKSSSSPSKFLSHEDI